jgi:hypothetical protein
MCEEERKKKKVVGCVTWCFFLFVEKLYKPPKVDGDERKGGPPFLTSTPGRRSSQMKTSAPLHLFIFSFYEMCCVGKQTHSKTKPSFIIPKSIKRDETLINADEKIEIKIREKNKRTDVNTENV